MTTHPPPHCRLWIFRLRSVLGLAALWSSLVLAAGLGTGCVESRARADIDASPEVIESTQRFRREYVLAPGDAIEVIVRGNESVSRQCVVRPDGYISIPLIRDVKASGQTVAGLGKHLTELLAPRLNDPEVTVIALSVRQPMVYVLGEVGVPQPVPLRDARTAAQAIAYSGGMKNTASVRNVAVIRLTEEGKLRAITMQSDVKGQPVPYMMLNTMLLEPEDVIFVPESQQSQFVRVVNDYVNTPLSGINQVLTPYFQYRLIAVIEEDD